MIVHPENWAGRRKPGKQTTATGGETLSGSENLDLMASQKIKETPRNKTRDKT